MYLQLEKSSVLSLFLLKVYSLLPFSTVLKGRKGKLSDCLEHLITVKSFLSLSARVLKGSSGGGGGI
jgi:hypothetical protein